MASVRLFEALVPLRVLLAAASLALGEVPPAQAEDRSGGDAGAAMRERGEYLTHHVAMCIQCHSPRDRSGNLIERKLLRGGRILVRRPNANKPWAVTAPRLAGLPGWQDGDVTTLLTQGHRPDAPPPRPPMPPFRLHLDDARAIVTYLRSLE